MRKLTVLWILLLAGVLSSCSEAEAPLVPPQAPCGSVSERLSQAPILWGIWDVSFSPSSEYALVSPLRHASFTCNVTGFLQPPYSKKNLVSIKVVGKLTDWASGYVVADVSLTHPFPGLAMYTGFDVRGVVVGDGSVTGIKDPAVRHAGFTDLYLFNADGLTRWFNPQEFTSYGTIFGFTQGKLGTPSNDFSATVNAYRYFCDGLDKIPLAWEFFDKPGGCPNPRGVFSAGNTLERRYELQFPVVDGEPSFRFQYAVIASWDAPSKIPPDNIPADFSYKANCRESFTCKAVDFSSMYYVNDDVRGGTLRLLTQVFCHTDNAVPVSQQISAIHLEIPDGPIPGGVATFQAQELLDCLVSENSLSATFMLEVSETLPPSAQSWPVLITVESIDSNGYYSGFPGFDYPETARLSAYYRAWVTVSSSVPEHAPVAIAEIVTQPPFHACWEVEFDASASFDPDGGDIVKYEWDFNNDGIFGDPFSSGTEVKPVYAFKNKGDYLVNLRVTDDEGWTGTLEDLLFLSIDTYGWARTWGGQASEESFDTAFDSSGNVYVVGRFAGTCDFDPGPGADERTSLGNRDVFLTKYDPDGNYQWTRVWGGATTDQPDEARGVDVDSQGNVYVTGVYRGTVDFDPGPGSVTYTSAYGNDVFLSSFAPNGDFRWVRVWGGSYNEDYGRAITVDKLDNILVAGSFRGTVDFNPGPAVENHTALNGIDSFVCKYASDGTFLWAKTWGGSWECWAYGNRCDSSGAVYVTGNYRQTVDFDPGPGTDYHTSNNNGTDFYLTKLDSNGNFLWARTWGSTKNEMAYDVVVDSQQNPCVTGWFYGPCDFDPGPGEDIRNTVSSDWSDAFLSKFDSSGNYLWAVTWGGADSDNSWAAAIDSKDCVYVGGMFYGTADLDPGPDVLEFSSGNITTGYFSKLNPDGSLQFARAWAVDFVEGIDVDLSDNAAVAGAFWGTADFDTGPCVDLRTSIGYWDAFVCKYPPDGNW